jgi:hypothetical protein
MSWRLPIEGNGGMAATPEGRTDEAQPSGREMAKALKALPPAATGHGAPDWDGRPNPFPELLDPEQLRWLR